MAISDAVGLELRSRVVGYKPTKGDFSDSTPNLPQRIAVFCEVNTANQGTVDFNTAKRITSAQAAGNWGGFGSPAHILARILFPVNGGGSIGGIPVYFMPQSVAVDAVACEKTVEVSGTATAGGTHYVVIGGRYSVDGGSYAVNIAAGDTATEVAVKIYNTVNNVLGCPMTATQTSPVAETTTLVSKWKGLTADGITVSVDTNGNDLGLTYTVTDTVAGSGTNTVAASLTKFFGNEWYTLVLNSYGFTQTIIDEFQAFNGIPDPDNPTGRYSPTIFKPFLCLTGTTLNTDVDTADTVICDAEKTEVTIVPCPAPSSPGLPMEAAANALARFARCAQDTPHLDIGGRSYPDMPVATTQFAMQSYTVRDALVKMGMSTVDLVAGAYQVQDFVTTYHPVGEVPPQFRYARNLNLDYNVRYSYFLLEQLYVVDSAIANDGDEVEASSVITPSAWKATLYEMYTDLTKRALIADPAFSKASTQVAISSTNPDRLETFFRYKRTGVTRISSTTAEAGFNFGTA